MEIQDAMQVTFGTSGKLKGQPGTNCNFIGGEGQVDPRKAQNTFLSNSFTLAVLFNYLFGHVGLASLVGPFCGQFSSFLTAELRLRVHGSLFF